MNPNTDYSYRLHDRLTEEDPELATVMYSTHGIAGPWHDMATCHPDYIWDIVGALEWVEENRRNRVDREMEELADYVAGENKFDITLESQGDAKLTSNLLDLARRLRDVNVYSPGQVTELAFEAAELLEARRG